MSKRKRREHPRVFISYSHDSPEHADKVLAFANKLRSEGIDAILDQYEDSPPEGWPKWMDREIEKCDFVVLVCTARYLQKVMGKVEEGEGLGVKWESTLAYQDLYDAGGENTRYIPVLFKDATAQDIPKPLRGATHYLVDEEGQYDDLYWRLRGVDRIKKPELGKLRDLPRLQARERKTDFFAGDSSEEGKGKLHGHQKIAHVKEITSQLRKKGRQKKAHKCHNDDEEKRECKVQKHSVGLAFEVRDFDSETNKTLELLDALLVIELKSDDLGSSKSYKRAKYKLDEPVRNFFRLLEVEAEEYFRAWKKENDEELLKKLIEKSTKKLTGLKLVKEISLSMAEELSIFIRALACYKLQRNVGSSEEQGQDYDPCDNTVRIKSSAATVRGCILSYMQSYLNENVELIDRSVDGFSHPFKVPPPTPPPQANPEQPVPIQEISPPQTPKDGSKQEEKSK